MNDGSQIKENFLEVCETRDLEKGGHWNMMQIFQHSRDYPHSISNMYQKPG